MAQVLAWFDSHRLLAAAVVFVLMYVVKNVPWVEANVLKTPRLRMVGTAFCATFPAVVLLVSGAELSAVWETAVTAFFSSIGIHTTWKLIKGDPIGVAKQVLDAMKNAAPVVFLVVAIGGLTGCASSLQVGAEVANQSAALGQAVAPVLEERCITPLRTAIRDQDGPKAKAIVEKCEPAVDAYDGFRTAHVLLRAGLVAMASGGTADVATLIAAITAATTKLTTAMGGL